MKSSVTQNKSSLKVDRELQDIFVNFHQKLVVTFRKKVEDFMFTFTQMEVLRFVLENKNPTMKDIAAYLSISAPSATSIIEHLSDKKLISRKMDTQDRRTVRIFLTLKAAKLFSSFMAAKNQIFRDMFKNLSRQEKKELIVILNKLI